MALLLYPILTRARPLNNTLVYGSNGYCVMDGTTSGPACTTLRGGSYNPIGSTTRQVAADNAYPHDTGGLPKLDFFTDRLALNGTLGIDNFAIGVPLADWGQQGYHPMMAVGLGANSTILSTLKSAGKIASRSWSMFWGLDGVAQSSQMDGVFVFGGYDKAKLKGTGFTQPLDLSQTTCSSGIVVSITDMVLNFPNGTDASLFSGPKTQAILSCIVPDYPVLMTLPLDPYFDRFQVLTNTTLSDRSTGLVFFANRYSPDSTP